jgi:transcriptional regulator with XRE-family HTH domain
MPEKRGSSRDLDAICFGLIVKRLRMQKGWTLQQLAGVTGLHANYLGVIERGGNTPSLQSFIQISHCLGVHAAETMREIVETRSQFRRRPQPAVEPTPETKPEPEPDPTS